MVYDKPPSRKCPDSIRRLSAFANQSTLAYPLRCTTFGAALPQPKPSSIRSKVSKKYEYKMAPTDRRTGVSRLRQQRQIDPRQKRSCSSTLQSPHPPTPISNHLFRLSRHHRRDRDRTVETDGGRLP